MLTWQKVERRIECAREALEASQYTIKRLDGLPTAEAVKAIATYAVRKGAGEDAPYTVVFYETIPTGKCTCPDFKKHSGPACKHTAMVVLDEWPDRFEKWQDLVRELCAPEPEPQAKPEPQVTVPAERLHAAVKQAVHETLQEMEGKITATLTSEIQRIALGILANG